MTDLGNCNQMTFFYWFLSQAQVKFKFVVCQRSNIGYYGNILFFYFEKTKFNLIDADIR